MKWSKKHLVISVFMTNDALMEQIIWVCPPTGADQIDQMYSDCCLLSHQLWNNMTICAYSVKKSRLAVVKLDREWCFSVVIFNCSNGHIHVHIWRLSHTTTETTKKVVIVHTHHNFFHHCNNFFNSFVYGQRFSQQFFRKIFVKIFVVCKGLNEEVHYFTLELLP